MIYKYEFRHLQEALDFAKLTFETYPPAGYDTEIVIKQRDYLLWLVVVDRMESCD